MYDFENDISTIRKLLKIRIFEKKLLELFNDGKINGTTHTCIGQEEVALSVVKNINDDDFIFSNHRGHGHYLARFKDIEGLISEVMGRESGCSGGYGGSQHLCNKNFL